MKKISLPINIEKQRSGLIIKLVVIYLSIASSCTKREVVPSYKITCQTGNTNFRSIDGSSYVNNLSTSDTLVNYVIRNEEDYKIRVGNLFTPIDFTRETLLAGRFNAKSGDGVIMRTVTRDCEKDVLLFRIQLKHGGAAAFTRVSYFAVVPRISESTKVNFEVYY